MRVLFSSYDICAQNEDGATKIEDLERLESKFKEIENEGHAVAVGSRAHLVSSDAVAKVFNAHPCGHLCTLFVIRVNQHNTNFLLDFNVVSQ
jgi:hypothetical protein